jgi:iron complex outermembrane receptor protein
MKSIRHIAFIFALLLSYCVFSQNSLSGKITDSISHSPLEGAVVYIQDLRVTAQTKAEGTFSLNNIPQGSYLVEIHLIGYGTVSKRILVNGAITWNISLLETSFQENEVVITGNSSATATNQTPQSTTEVSKEYLDENSSTNVIDAIAKTPGVSAMTDGQSISKPVIRGLGYNRVVTVDDGVVQVDQAWFDEFGIEVDPDAVERAEILKGPASLAYGSDAIAGVVNLIPEKPLPEGQIKGEVMNNYQTNNGLINNMFHLAGTNDGISWSARVDNIMAHSYQDPYDGYALNSQFSNFNTDGTIGIHGKWGYSQVHASYFDMATGIVDGTRDPVTGALQKQVAYPVYGDTAAYVTPTHQEQTSYTPFVINQHIQHTKIAWDNNISVGKGHITGIFSYQLNQRQETNDPTQPNIPDIYYYSNAATYDVRYVSPQMGGFNYSAGANGLYQASQSLGTLMLVPNYDLFQIGGFAIANEKIGNLNLSGGLRWDTRTFTGIDHWVNSNQEPVPANTLDGIHEFQGFTTTFNGMSGSLGAAYNFNNNFYLKGYIAQGFRAPNVSECAANGIHDGTIVWELGDPDLKPEISLEEDISVGMTGKDISFEVDLFNNSINDFIYAKGLSSKILGPGGKTVDSTNNTFPAVSLGSPAPVYKYTQGNAQLYGGEAILNIHPRELHWIELNSSLSVVQGGLLHVPDTIKYLPFVPPTRITVDLKFKRKTLGKGIKNAYFKIGLLNCFQQSQIYEQYAVYNGYSKVGTPFEYAASKTATAGYILFNAGLGGDLLNSAGHTFAKLYIVCNNIFNTAYMDYMSRFKYDPVNYATDRVGVFNMGRNISIKLIIPLDIK